MGGAVVGGTIAGFKGNNIWLGKPVAEGRGIFSFNNTPIKAPPTTNPVNGTFGSSGTTNIKITRVDGDELLIRGNTVTDRGALATNIDVDGNPTDLWNWITANNPGAVTSYPSGTMVYQTSNMTFAFYPVATSTNAPAITVFDKVLNKEWLKIRF